MAHSVQKCLKYKIMPHRVQSHAGMKKHQKLNFGSKIECSKMNKNYVFGIFKKNAANEKLRILARISVKNSEIFMQFFL